MRNISEIKYYIRFVDLKQINYKIRYFNHDLFATILKIFNYREDIHLSSLFFCTEITILLYSIFLFVKLYYDILR